MVAIDGDYQRTKPIWVYASGVVLMLALTVSIALNVGFCISSGRVLSEGEFFKGAIDAIIRDPIDGVTEYVPGASITNLVHSQRYRGSDEFFQENPHCCRFVSANSGDGGPDVGIVDHLLGVRVVEVSYVKKYADGSREKTSPVSARVAVTCCGVGRPIR